MTAVVPLVAGIAGLAGGLFGSKSSSPAPTPTPAPAAPSISDASVAAADKAQSDRLANRRGTDASMLTGGLGDSQTATQDKNVQRTTLLGGGG